MTRSRIAIFEGYGRRPSRRSSRRNYGAPLFENPRLQRYGAPLFENPRSANTRLLGYGRSSYGYDVETMPRGMGDGYGRRAYFVPPLLKKLKRGAYGPRALKRKGYKVKKGRNTAAQVRFKKAAKKCARIARGRNARKGAYQSCMRKTLRKKRRSRR